MNNKRPIAPAFINKLDRWLLLNKPSVWSSRIHLALFYSLIGLVLLTVISFLTPDDPRTDSLTGVWIGFVSVVAFIGLVIYVIYLLRFNVFKRFGNDGAAHRLAAFLLSFIAIGSFVLLPYVQPYVESVRASSQFSDEEINQDLNQFNMSIARLEYDSVDHQWSRDTVRIVDSFSIYDIRYNADYDRDVVVPVDNHTGIPVPRIRAALLREDLAKEIKNADSVIKINDFLYLFFKCPNYKPLSPYFGYNFSKKNQYSSLDIYHKVINNFTRPDYNEERQKINSLIVKYKARDFDYYYDP